MDYIGLKITGLDYWVWFKFESLDETSDWVTANNGWGKNRCVVNISIASNMIEGRILSDAPG